MAHSYRLAISTVRAFQPGTSSPESWPGWAHLHLEKNDSGLDGCLWITEDGPRLRAMGQAHDVGPNDWVVRSSSGIFHMPDPAFRIMYEEIA